MNAGRCEQWGWHGGRRNLPQDESKCVQCGSELGLPCPTEKGRGLRTIEGIVPVELKPSNKPPARIGVYPNHVIQNLAHCVRVEEQLKAKVPYGLVIYAGQQVRRMELTTANREWLIRIIAEVKAARFKKSLRLISSVMIQSLISL